jgi:MFS family permease
LHTEWASNICSGIFGGVIGPQYAFVARRDLGASDFVISLIVAAETGASLLSAVWAKLLKPLPKVVVVFGGGFVARSLLAGTGLATHETAYAVCVIGYFAISSAGGPFYMALLKQMYPQQYRGRIVASLMFVGATATMVGTLIGGPLLEGLGKGSYRIVFPVSAIFGLMASCLMLRLRPGPSATPESEMPPLELPALLEKAGVGKNRLTLGIARMLHEPIVILREDPAFRMWLVCVFFFGFGNIMTQPLRVLFHSDVLHLTKTQQSLTVLGMMGAYSLGNLLWGRVTDRIGGIKVLIASVAILALSPILYFVAPNWWFALAANVVMGIGFSATDVSYTTSILNFAPQGRAEEYQALHATLLGIRGWVAPILAVRMIAWMGGDERAIRHLFLVAFGVVMIGLCMTFFLIKEMKRSRGGVDAV